jgi:hypothetical protein
MTPRLTKARRDELRRIADSATPGPWETREDEDYYQCGTYIGVEPFHYDCGREVDGRGKDHTYFRRNVCRVESHEADQRFLIEARTALPELLDEVDRLEAENERLREALETVRDELTKYEKSTAVGMSVFVALGAASRALAGEGGKT